MQEQLPQGSSQTNLQRAHQLSDHQLKSLRQLTTNFSQSLSTLEHPLMSDMVEVSYSFEDLIAKATTMFQKITSVQPAQTMFSSAAWKTGQSASRIQDYFNGKKMSDLRKQVSQNATYYIDNLLEVKLTLIDAYEKDVAIMQMNAGKKENSEVKSEILRSFKSIVNRQLKLLVLVQKWIKSLAAKTNVICSTQMTQIEQRMLIIDESLATMLSQTKLDNEQEENQGKPYLKCLLVFLLLFMGILIIVRAALLPINSGSSLIIALIPCWGGPTLLMAWLWIRWAVERLFNDRASLEYIRETNNVMDDHTQGTMTSYKQCRKTVLCLFTILYMVLMGGINAADYLTGCRQAVAWASVTFMAFVFGWIAGLEMWRKTGERRKNNGLKLSILTIQKLQSLTVPVFCFISTTLSISEPVEPQLTLSSIVFISMCYSALLIVIKSYSDSYVLHILQNQACFARCISIITTLLLSVGLASSALIAYQTSKTLTLLLLCGGAYLIRVVFSFYLDKVFFGQSLPFSRFQGNRPASLQSYLTKGEFIFSGVFYFIQKLLLPLAYWLVLVKILPNQLLTNSIIMLLGLLMIVGAAGRQMVLLDVQLINDTRKGCVFPSLERLNDQLVWNQVKLDPEEIESVNRLERCLDGFKNTVEPQVQSYFKDRKSGILKAIEEAHFKLDEQQRRVKENQKQSKVQE